MFHRQRPGIQVRPVMSEDTPAEEVQQEAPEAMIQEEVIAEEAPQPIYQPQPAQKEAEPMSNFNPTYPNETAPEPVATAAPNAQPVQMPGTSSFNPQQRPSMQPMARTPYSGYAPSYGSASPEAAVSTGRKLVIGEGITMSGEIEACDHLVVEGTVEATLKGASILDVSQAGMFFGAVEINEATIAGRFEGDITVNGRLTVRSTGTITGTVSYKELAVESGATIDGKINPLREGRVVTTEKKPQTAKVTSKPLTAPESANELPFAGNKAHAAAE